MSETMLLGLSPNDASNFSKNPYEFQFRAALKFHEERMRMPIDIIPRQQQQQQSPLVFHDEEVNQLQALFRDIHHQEPAVPAAADHNLVQPQVAEQANDPLISLTNDVKPRLRWGWKLHERFLDAIDILGGAFKATPRGLLNIMKTRGLTLYQVKSHLQKYRMGRPSKRKSSKRKSKAIAKEVKGYRKRGKSAIPLPPPKGIRSSSFKLSHHKGGAEGLNCIRGSSSTANTGHDENVALDLDVEPLMKWMEEIMSSTDIDKRTNIQIAEETPDDQMFVVNHGINDTPHKDIMISWETPDQMFAINHGISDTSHKDIMINCETMDSSLEQLDGSQMMCSLPQLFDGSGCQYPLTVLPAISTTAYQGSYPTPPTAGETPEMFANLSINDHVPNKDLNWELQIDRVQLDDSGMMESQLPLPPLPTIAADPVPYPRPLTTEAITGSVSHGNELITNSFLPEELDEFSIDSLLAKLGESSPISVLLEGDHPASANQNLDIAAEKNTQNTAVLLATSPTYLGLDREEMDMTRSLGFVDWDMAELNPTTAVPCTSPGFLDWDMAGINAQTTAMAASPGFLGLDNSEMADSSDFLGWDMTDINPETTRVSGSPAC